MELCSIQSLYTPCFGEIWIKDFALTLIILSILLKDRHLFRYTISILQEKMKSRKRLLHFSMNTNRTGFEDFVKDVRSKGIKTAVVTSSNLEKMLNVYNKHPEFKGYFDEILTSEDFEESKPSPDCYFKAAARFGVSPKECIVFEDSFNGLRSGIASGARVIGLATTNSVAEIEPYTKEVISNYDGFTLSDH